MRRHAGLLLLGDPSLTWLGFDTSRPEYHSVWTLSSSCLGSGISSLFISLQGLQTPHAMLLSLPFWGSKTLFCATLLNEDHHTLLGPLDVAYMGLPFWHCLRTDSLPSLSCFVDTLISALALISQAKCCPPTVWMFSSVCLDSDSLCQAALLHVGLHYSDTLVWATMFPLHLALPHLMALGLNHSERTGNDEFFLF